MPLFYFESKYKKEAMKSFLTRPKRKSSPGPPSDPANGEESTELKLALLSSLCPQLDQETLLDVLLAHDGSVSQATSSLQETRSHSGAKRSSSISGSGSSGVIGLQKSLREYTTASPPGDPSSQPPPQKKAKSKKGSTLHLYDPVDIAEHTPCSIIHNFLPVEEADDLLRELLKEAESFEKITFKLFENVVSSPHTSSFYVETYDDIKTQKTDYYYNGGMLTVSLDRMLLSLSLSLHFASAIIEA